VDGDLLPAALVAKRLGVSKQLVYWWVRTGKLERAATAADGRRPLYSLRSAAEVDKATSRSPYSHRVTSAA